tara:strand:- start:232 stop:702 length:471 start_codon:yes stop_codon:yes gene_type:complete
MALTKIADAGMPSGAVLQVVQTVKTDDFSTSSSSFVDITGLSAVITPLSTSSKVLVDVRIGGYDVTSASTVFFNIVRGSTTLSTGTAGTGTACTFAVTANADRGENAGMLLLDSPSTTSATTYKVQTKTGGINVDINKRSGLHSNISTITLTEIAG